MTAPDTAAQHTAREGEARTWCGQCDDARNIVETFDDVIQERHGQRGVRVTRFSCGHEQVRYDGSWWSL